LFLLRVKRSGGQDDAAGLFGRRAWKITLDPVQESHYVGRTVEQ
jgi:hypothetical protein